MLIDAAAAVFRAFPPEIAHRLTILGVKCFGPLLPAAAPDDPRLAVDAFGLRFPNPLGLAAGFDKDVEVPAAMLRLGFGFVECGTVTPRSQTGNPRPRLFRLGEDRAVINRMGFNNRGMAAAAHMLAAGRAPGIVGINIGANKDSADRTADYVACFEALAPLASYVAINVSSPNTPGLRGLQDRDALERLLGSVTAARARSGRTVPLLLKIAPDLDGHALDDIADVAQKAALDGIIVSNTTVSRPPDLKSPHAMEAGGLSGAPLFALSTRILAELRRRTALPLVGVGGIASGADAYAKIRAGASLVQLYTALAYQGPGLVPRIKRELLACLVRDGFAHVRDAVGIDA